MNCIETLTWSCDCRLGQSGPDMEQNVECGGAVEQWSSEVIDDVIDDKWWTGVISVYRNCLLVQESPRCQYATHTTNPYCYCSP